MPKLCSNGTSKAVNPKCMKTVDQTSSRILCVVPIILCLHLFILFHNTENHSSPQWRCEKLQKEGISCKNHQKSLILFSQLASFDLFLLKVKSKEGGATWHNAPLKYTPGCTALSCSAFCVNKKFQIKNQNQLFIIIVVVRRSV